MKTLKLLIVPFLLALAISAQTTICVPAYTLAKSGSPYPAQCLAPYPVTVSAAGTTFVGDNSANVCTQAQAQTLANSLTSAFGVPVTVSLQPPMVAPSIPTNPSDPRGLWMVGPIAGTSFTGYLAQPLITAQNLYGVGAPGYWTFAPPAGHPNDPASLTWVNQPLSGLTAEIANIRAKMQQLSATLTFLQKQTTPAAPPALPNVP